MEGFDAIWQRAQEWRADPVVASTLSGVRTFEEWAAATRSLDRRYAGPDDQYPAAEIPSPQPPDGDRAQGPGSAPGIDDYPGADTGEGGW